MINQQIKDSGLADMLNIRPLTTDIKLAKFLGKNVQYKRELLTPAFIRSHGTLAVSATFLIKQVQENYNGKPCLRGYFEGDNFGRCIEPSHIEII